MKVLFFLVAVIGSVILFSAVTEPRHDNGMFGPSASGASRRATPTPGPISRAAFTERVQHEKAATILTRFGRPATTQSFTQSQQDIWYYHAVTFDPTTGQTDSTAQIVFDTSAGQSTAIDVNYYP